LAFSYRFRDIATYILKLCTENCGQTAAGTMVTYCAILSLIQHAFII